MRVCVCQHGVCTSTIRCTETRRYLHVVNTASSSPTGAGPMPQPSAASQCNGCYAEARHTHTHTQAPFPLLPQQTHPPVMPLVRQRHNHPSPSSPLHTQQQRQQQQQRPALILPYLSTHAHTHPPTCDAAGEEVLAAVVEALIHEHSTHAVNCISQATRLTKGSAVEEAPAQHTCGRQAVGVDATDRAGPLSLASAFGCMAVCGAPK